MIEIDSCPTCHIDFSEEFEKKLKKSKKALHCEFCGAPVKREKVDSQPKLIEHNPKSSNITSTNETVENDLKSNLPGQKSIREARLFLYRQAYELMKNSKYIFELEENEEMITPLLLKNLSKLLRHEIRKQSIQDFWPESSDANRKDLENSFFKGLQARLKGYIKCRKRYMELFQESIQFVLELMVGKRPASTVLGDQSEVLEDLKENYGFSVNDKKPDCFEVRLTLFLASEIYALLKHPECDLELTEDRKELTTSFIDKLATALLSALNAQQKIDEWTLEFDRKSKRIFKKKFKDFQIELKTDYIYYESVLAHLRRIINLVFGLFNGTLAFTDLLGIEFYVTDHLKKSCSFVKDCEFSLFFKQNLVLVATRIACAIIDYNIKANEIKITDSFLESVAKKLTGVLMSKKGLKSEVTKNLKKITQSEFKTECEKIRSKLCSDAIYRQNFLEFSQKLARIVFKLISEKYDVLDLPVLERTIAKDLESNRFNIESFLQASNSTDGNKKIKEGEIINTNNDKLIASSQNTHKNSSFLPDIEDICVLSKQSEKYYITAILDTGASLAENLMNFDLAERLGLEINLNAPEVIQMAGTELEGYPCETAIIFRGIRFDARFLSIRKLTGLLSFSVLLSKPSLMKYSELTGQNGKIILDLNDQPKYRQYILSGTTGLNRLNTECKDTLEPESDSIQQKEQKFIDISKQVNVLYVPPTKKIYINLEETESLHSFLKNNRGSITSFNKEILNFKKLLTGNQTIRESEFIKLKILLKKKFGENILIDLYGIDDIPHKIYLALGSGISHSQFEYLELKDSCDLAEFVCIMCGDGHLCGDGKLIQISFSKDEPNYISYVVSLMSRLFNIENNAITIKAESKRGVALILHRSNIHYALVNKGLKIGNKTIGQSTVPDFVFNNLDFIECGLRGLFDTDGSLFVSTDGYLGISFSNRSQNLVIQFSKMFTLLFSYDISKISERIADDGSVTWYVFTQSIQKVKDFLDKIKPERFKEPYKRLWLGLRCIFLKSNSDVISAVTNKIRQWKSENKKYIFQYSIENAVLLKKWCEEIFMSFNIDNVQGLPFSGYISNDMIERALTSALVYLRYP